MALWMVVSGKKTMAAMIAKEFGWHAIILAEQVTAPPNLTFLS